MNENKPVYNAASFANLHSLLLWVAYLVLPLYFIQLHKWLDTDMLMFQVWSSWKAMLFYLTFFPT